MKLNCDMGESFGPWLMGNDEALMPLIDMANIACGFHASDPQTMDKTVQLAVEHGVSIGAHPGYPDREGFGRRHIAYSPKEITMMILYQVGALQAICRAHGTKVDYIKPHGALYNTMMVDAQVMAAVFDAVTLAGAGTALMLMAGSADQHYRQQAKEKKIPLIFEAFCDRVYTRAGTLAPRQQEGAVHDNVDAICGQASDLIRQKKVNSIDGKQIDIEADTLCIHGDNPLSPVAAQRIREIICAR